MRSGPLRGRPSKARHPIAASLAVSSHGLPCSEARADHAPPHFHAEISEDEVRIAISNGRTDPLVSAEETEHLAALLRSAGAEVTVAWQGAGHELTESDITTAREWLTKQPLLAR